MLLTRFVRFVEPPQKYITQKFPTHPLYFPHKIIVLGSILSYTFIFLHGGEPKFWPCILKWWFLLIGFNLFFGSLSLKLYRIIRIFQSGALLKTTLTNTHLMATLSVIVVIQMSLLTLWTLYDNDGIVDVEVGINGAVGVVGVKQRKCDLGNELAFMGMLAVNGVMVASAVVCTVQGRNVPEHFNEGRFAGASVISMGKGFIFCLGKRWFFFC